MRTALLVGVAGFFGSVARYGVAGLVGRVNEDFPWGTFVINVTGSFALGVLVGMFAHRLVLHPDLRIAITVGFLGAYTTFSTFTLETLGLFETGKAPWAMAYVVASVIAGITAVWLGTSLGRGL
jgi:CrcB protein